MSGYRVSHASRLNFQVEKTASGSQARAGRFKTLHNEVITPLFMPVATLGTVRAQKTETLFESGSQILLSNTYHLLQRPGTDVLKEFGGLHGFMKWPRGLLTDSGGYQIFSLPKMREMKEEGAWFRSSLDGEKIFLSPEKSIETQKIIGSDIMMVLDQCIDSTSPRDEAVRAMDLTHRWARRSLEARGDSPQSLFGIVQGACFEDLRRESAEFLRELPFDGLAIGGLAVGEGRDERERMTEATTKWMPENLPRYLMGVGTPIDLLEAVHRGVDMFDCILPTAFAQQGMSFSSRGRIVLRRGVYRLQKGPIDETCPCPTCAKYDRAYLHHLIKSREILGWNLVGTHNLYFYHRMMREIREAIFEDRFVEYYKKWRDVLPADDQDNPVNHPKPKGKRLPPPLELGDYRVKVSEKGHASIQQISSNEIMHSVSDPIEEARRLYVEQPRLVERVTAFFAESGDDSSREFVIWDVGLGAGTNAMAAIGALETAFAPAEELVQGSTSAVSTRKIRIVSFENDLNSLRLALLHPTKFPYLKHGAPYTLEKEKRWLSKDGLIEWNLHVGDFLTEYPRAAKPDLVLYDPFSFKVDSPLWSGETFRALRKFFGEREVELFTYSNSTAIRGILLASGFYVARGVPTPPKGETTVATTSRRFEREYLAQEWLDRWMRSGARIEALDAEVRGHEQFRND